MLENALGVSWKVPRQLDITGSTTEFIAFRVAGAAASVAVLLLWQAQADGVILSTRR